MSASTGNKSDRDSFAAYVCDQPTMDIVRTVISDLNIPEDNINLGGLRNAVQSLSVSASPTILLVDLSECADPLSDINALAEVCEPGTMVVAMGKVNDVRLYRELIASGIQDYLLKPLSEQILREAMVSALAVFNSPRNSAANGGGTERTHVSTAVVGTRGGVGATTIASSLAWFFSDERKLPTALLDLDVHFGTGALVMDLEPGRGLTDAMDNPSRIDGLFIERAMVRANENLSVLSAEAAIGTPLMTDGSAFVRLSEEFRQAFDMTVIDLPRNMLINFPHVLAETNAFVLVTELTLASARDAIRILSWVTSNAQHVTPIIVCNKMPAGQTEITRKDFEASIERKIDIVIAEDAKAAVNAAKQGETFIEANRNSKAGGAIADLANRIYAMSGDGEPVSGKSEKSALKGMFDLRALLGTKQKA
ncbi:pilus assembly protein CpaE [uncultured Croceicoccus sp.]|uniref:pilus assembly protein CpaE n=1 Tax=uncultured Croceicoccus sp. TaxID=1295329 RepID=UPI0026159476|nr:pilus assembly protein CpaE [uncultured Croceicoccus sp.]